MHRSLRGLLALGVVLLLRATSLTAQDSAHVVVVSTTDIHGRATHWDYVLDREAPWGVDRVATVVDSLRKQFTGGDPNREANFDANYTMPEVERAWREAKGEFAAKRP